jgi:hypothetical protein
MISEDGYCRNWQENMGNSWSMEAVFPSGIFRVFSDDFRTVPTGILLSTS